MACSHVESCWFGSLVVRVYIIYKVSALLRFLLIFSQQLTCEEANVLETMFLHIPPQFFFSSTQLLQRDCSEFFFFIFGYTFPLYVSNVVLFSLVHHDKTLCIAHRTRVLLFYFFART